MMKFFPLLPTSLERAGSGARHNGERTCPSRFLNPCPLALSWPLSRAFLITRSAHVRFFLPTRLGLRHCPQCRGFNSGGELTVAYRQIAFPLTPRATHPLKVDSYAASAISALRASNRTLRTLSCTVFSPSFGAVSSSHSSISRDHRTSRGTISRLRFDIRFLEFRFDIILHNSTCHHASAIDDAKKV